MIHYWVDNNFEVDFKDDPELIKGLLKLLKG
jgi:hypothetical protein